jgi:uncharacterized protein VirK/YbjX
MRSKVEEGKWRINVKTEQGQIIGRVRFIVKEAQTPPTLHTEEKI